MSLNISLNRYRNEVVKADRFIKNAYKTDDHGNLLIPKDERDFITSASFLVFFMAWEQFLEECTVKFMRGKKTISGNTVIKYVKPVSDKHAHELLIGVQRYVDWANPEIVKKLANLVFAPNNPISTVLNSIHLDLLDLKNIRNSAAHLSSTTSAQLDAVATRKLGVPSSNINVAEFILFTDPNAVAPDITFFDTYITLMDAAADSIAR